MSGAFDSLRCPECGRQAVSCSAKPVFDKTGKHFVGTLKACVCECDGSRTEWFLCSECHKKHQRSARVFRKKHLGKRHMLTCKLVLGAMERLPARVVFPVHEKTDICSNESGQARKLPPTVNVPDPQDDNFPMESSSPECLPDPSTNHTELFSPSEPVEPSVIQASESLREYFDVVTKACGGRLDLAAATSTMRPSIGNKSATWIFDDDLKEEALTRLSLYLRIGTVASELGSNMRLVFASIIDDLQTQIIPRTGKHDNNEKVFSIRLPSTVGEFISHYFNRTNSDSLMSVVPSPEVRRIEGTQLSHVSLSDAVAHAMMVPRLNSTLDHHHSRYKSLAVSSRIVRAVRMRIRPSDPSLEHRPHLLAAVFLWCDGWDPNRSSKSNRGSVWTCTACLVFFNLLDNGSCDPVSVVNQVLCCGMEKEDHDPFFRRLRDETKTVFQDSRGGLLPQLGLYRFQRPSSGASVEQVVIHVFVCAALMDQPERRDCVGLLRGNSIHHPLFGVACGFSNLPVPFEACDRCLERMIQQEADGGATREFDTRCDGCLCWDTDNLTAVAYRKPPSDPPPADIPGARAHSGPTRIDFETCAKIWKACLNKYCYEKTWTAERVRQHFSVNGMSKVLVDQFVTRARQHILALEVENPGSPVWIDVDHRLDFLQEMANAEESFLLPPCHPAAWDLFKVEEMVETPMHAAMNCQKAVLVTCLRFCTRFKKESEMVRQITPLLENIKSLKLEEVRAMPFNGEKFGGYVAETYRAAAMLMPWLSLVFLRVEMEPSKTSEETVVQLPDPRVKPHDKWTKKENSMWLKIRGIKFDGSSNAADLQDLVHKWRLDPKCPDIKEKEDEEEDGMPHARDEPPSTLRRLLLQCHLFFQALFSETHHSAEGRNRALLRCKVFLTLWNKVDRLAVPKRDKPIHIAKFNSICLLRCCESFLEHGLVRNLHEGGEMGEGIVKHLREFCHPVAKDKWSLNLVHAFYRNASMRLLLHDMDRPLAFADAEEQQPLEGRETAGSESQAAPTGDSSMHTANIGSSPIWQNPNPPSVASRRNDGSFWSLKCRRHRTHDSHGSATDEHPSNLMSRRLPISAVAHRCAETGRIQFSVATTKGFLLMKLNQQHLHHDALGFRYFGFEATPHLVEVKPDGGTDCLKLKFHCCCLMLPYLLEAEDVVAPRYAVISHQWHWFDGETFHERMPS